MTSIDQFTLPSPPFDSVSKVRYSPKDDQYLLVSAWDATVRLYSIGQSEQESEQKVKYDQRAAVLDCCFSTDAKSGYCGGLDHTVRHLDLSSEKIQPIGSHSDAVSCMVYASRQNALVTGSWDRTVRVWDPRASTTTPQISTQTVERVYHMDMAEGSNVFVAALASRLFHIYDIRRMEMATQERESSLKFMTRTVACMASGEGYAAGSVEGRIAVEYYDPSKESQTKKYAFKCHRTTEKSEEGEVDIVYPVNALAFHPKFNTFVSAGSDGVVSTWDHLAKKRLRQFPKFKDPVSSIAFSPDGNSLAIATSYTWDQGQTGFKAGVTPTIYIRNVGDEVKPRDYKGEEPYRAFWEPDLS